MMQEYEENLSDTMEMYLVTIARLREGGQPVPLSQLAEALSVTAVSVNEMCRKLQENGLLIYRPYKGALLTESGEKLANHTLRRHRIWEVFLVEKLRFDYPAAHKISCQLEHATTEKVIDSLDAYLGFPIVNPIGYPIPKSDKNKSARKSISLVNVPVGRIGMVVYCNVSEIEMNFLRGLGVQPQQKISVLASGNDNLLINVNDTQITLARNLAESIFVEVGEARVLIDHIEKSLDEVAHEMNIEEIN